MPIDVEVAATIAAPGHTAARDAFISNARVQTRSMFLRPMVDAAIAFAVLCIVGLTYTTAPTSAGPTTHGISALQATFPSAVVKAIGDQDVRPVVEIATTSSPANDDAAYRRTSVQTAWALLMIALSIVAALNLALFRHMRQAYKTPRRRPLKGE